MDIRAALSSLGSAIFGTGNTDKKENDTSEFQPGNDMKQDTNNDELFSNNNPYNQPLTHDMVIIEDANGELWRYNSKTDEMKLILKQVKAVIVDEKSNNYKCTFKILRKDGSVLLSEFVNNELQVQYNKVNHNMTFTINNIQKNRIEILSFIFKSKEHDFKMAMAIKLYESNMGESFAKMVKKNIIKEEEKNWIEQSYENEPNNEYNDYNDNDYYEFDDDVVMKSMKHLTLDGDDENEQQKVKDFIEDNDDDNYNDNNNEYKKTDLWDSITKGAKMNRDIVGAKKYNRTFVTRQLKNKSVLGYYKHNDSNELEYQGKIPIKSLNNEDFIPSKSMLHYNDEELLVLNKHNNNDDNNRNKISVLNLQKGKIVEEWETKPENLYNSNIGGIKDICPITKNSSMIGVKQLYGMNENSMFLIDGRINKKSKIVEEKENTYKSINDMTCINTSGNGYIATGSQNGNIRLYSKIGMKRANTCLSGLGNKIKYIDISDDGKWLCATCKDYILIINTTHNDNNIDKTGFQKSIPLKSRPRPYILRLKPKDIQKYQIRNVSFTAAKFDNSNESGFTEQWIISTTGPYIIKWNFNKLKKAGIVNDYSIRRAKSSVISSQFRFKHNKDLLISERDSVYAQHLKNKKQ